MIDCLGLVLVAVVCFLSSRPTIELDDRVRANLVAIAGIAPPSCSRYSTSPLS